MPTYDYKCTACGQAFEIFQGINDPKKRKCPACGKLKLERLIGTGVGVIFKGSGFYETDYKRKDAKSSGGDGADAKPSSGGAEKSSGTTDAPAAKPAAEKKADAKASSKAKKGSSPN